MSFGWLFRSGLALVLSLIVLIYLVRAGLWRRFPLVGPFCIVQIVVILIDTIAVLIGLPRRLQVQMIWTGDMVAHAAISLLIISLIWQTLDEGPRKNTVLLLTAGVMGFALASSYVFYDVRLSRWMTPVSRNLSFCEEVLNLILWSLLLKGKTSDYLLLMVSAGIGVQVTGEVIGHTLRVYASESIMWVPNTLVFISELVCLGIWIWAFRTAANRAVPALLKTS